LRLVKLRLAMLGTLTFIIAVSTLFMAVVLSLIGSFSILSLVFLVVLFNIVQWLLAPKLIDAIYRAKEVSRSDNPNLYGIVERLSSRIKMKMPKVMVANIPIPNAFAYSSPIAGTRVAVTRGLLDTLEEEEVEAVLGHELGHLKHRDVQIMMFVSVLPAVFYFLGYSLLMSSMYGGSGDRRGGGGSVALIAMVSMAMYWILTLLVLGLSRQREYYADRRSTMIVEDGSRKLSEALAKIVSFTGRQRGYVERNRGVNSFKTLFIADPDKAASDTLEISRFHTTDQKLVRDILSRKITTADRMLEVFSTHPNIVKRLRALQGL